MRKILKSIYVSGCLILAAVVGALALSLFSEPDLDIRDGSGIGNMNGDTFRGGSIYNLEADRIRRVAIRKKVGVEPLYWFFRVPMTDAEFSEFISMSGDFEAIKFSHTDSVPDLSEAPDWLPPECREQPVGHASAPNEPPSYVYRDDAGYTIFRSY